MILITAMEWEPEGLTASLVPCSLVWCLVFLTGTVFSLQSPVSGKKEEAKVCIDYPLPSGLCFPSRGGWDHIWFQPQPDSSLLTLGEEIGGVKGQGNI